MPNVVNDTDQFSREAFLLKPVLHSFHDSMGRTISFFASAQNADVAALQAQCCRIGGDIRPALIDNGDDAERNRNLLQLQPVGGCALRDDSSYRIREVNYITDTVSHSLDTAVGQQQAVKLHIADFAFCGFHIFGIFCQDLFCLLFNGKRHGEQCIVFLFAAELRKAFLRTYGVPDNVTSFHGSVPSVYYVLIYKYRYSFFAKNLVPTGSSSAIL